MGRRGFPRFELSEELYDESCSACDGCKPELNLKERPACRGARIESTNSERKDAQSKAALSWPHIPGWQVLYLLGSNHDLGSRVDVLVRRIKTFR
jgi:hypothetical protein